MTTVSATRPALTDLVAAVRQVIGMRADWVHTAHRIRNDGSETAISPHIYGTDSTRVGTSARRNYN